MLELEISHTYISFLLHNSRLLHGSITIQQNNVMASNVLLFHVSGIAVVMRNHLLFNHKYKNV